MQPGTRIGGPAERVGGGLDCSEFDVVGHGSMEPVFLSTKGRAAAHLQCCASHLTIFYHSATGLNLRAHFAATG